MSESLGARLRSAREAKGLTLDDVEKITRIRARFLAALEAETFAEIPSPVQVRGFLRNYAQHVGLNAEEILALYEQRRGQAAAAPLEASPRPAAPPVKPPETRAPARPAYQPRIPQIQSRRPRWLSADLFVAAGVTLALAALLIWGALQLAANLRADKTTAAGATAPASATPTATLAPDAGDAPTSAPLPSPLPVYVGVNVTVRAEQRVWLSVKSDGTEVFAGLLKPGDARDFVGQTSVEITTGNAKGTRVLWNGRDQGTLGEVGEVVVRAWTLTGMVIPTPTVTPTPTTTPTPTATERPSATPRASAAPGQ
jgi:cytoskeletal protein RodZ